MVDELIKYDLSLDVYFTYGPAAHVASRPVLPRREGQPIFMRGEVGVKDDGRLRPLVAHNTTHIDMPVHFLDGAADLHDVLNNPAYRVNLPLLTRVVDVSGWPNAQYLYENNGVRYCELVTVEMLPPVEELRQYDALVLLTGFGAVMRRGSEQYLPDAEGFFHMPGVTVEVAQRVAEAGLTLLAIDSPTVERQTRGKPLRMTGDVHPILLGHIPPVFILEAVAGDRLVPQVGFVPTEGILEVVPRRANAKGADAAPARVFLSFYRGPNNRQQLQRLIELITPTYLYG
ncbi:MAG: cyclase family protein [Candidatus Tectomicrobia bacterium]|nr:cyclase family protein [Candidatus Tectomicrobia bacterium]